MQRLLTVLLFLLLGLTSTACSNRAKQALGLSRKAPDEFTVISRAPLTLPPVFEMRPPKPGEVRPQEGSPLDAAREALITKGSENTDEGREILIGSVNNETYKNKTSGEDVLLKRAGADKADNNIRKVIEEESSSLIKESEFFVDKLVFWRDIEDPAAVEVDPNLELKRIQENAALGKDITEGDTPVIERRRKGIFEK